MDEDRPRFIERVERDDSPITARRNRSNTMQAVGVVLFLIGLVSAVSNSGHIPGGALLLGILGGGLLVGGLVIRR